MYIVNTSFFVKPEISGQWLEIINGKYIPFLKENGFNDIVFSRVLSEGNNVDGFTYSLMVHVEDMSQYKTLTNELFGEYTSIAVPMFGQDVVWFITVMKKLDC